MIKVITSIPKILGNPYGFPKKFPKKFLGNFPFGALEPYQHANGDWA